MYTMWMQCGLPDCLVCATWDLQYRKVHSQRQRIDPTIQGSRTLHCRALVTAMGEVHRSDSVCKPDISWMLCGYVSTRVTKYSIFTIVDVLFQFVSWFLFLLSQNRIYRIEQRQVHNLEDERRSPQMAVSSVHQDVCLCGSFGLQAEKGYHNFLRLRRLRPATSQLQHRYRNRPLGSHNHLHWTFPYRARSHDM